MRNEKNFFVHESSYIDDDVKIGEGTKIWYFCHVQRNVSIGKNCSFGQNVNIANDVKIGNGCRVQNNVSIYEGVDLGNDVFCGPSMVFTNDLTPRVGYPKGSKGYLKTVVHDGASIGANATIVCGHNLGRYSMVASGAVVTRDVLDYELVAGVPARNLGWVCECGTRLEEENLTCKQCGKKYKKEIAGLRRIK